MSEMSTPATPRAALVAAIDHAMRETSAQSVLLSQAVADRVGMNPTDLESLDILVRHGPMTAGRLAELTGLTTGAITGLVDRLERHGYATREPHPTDRRRVIVRALVAEAERDLAAPYVVVQQAMSELLARYSDEELATILDFLSRATEFSTDVIARIRADQRSPGGRGADGLR